MKKLKFLAFAFFFSMYSSYSYSSEGIRDLYVIVLNLILKQLQKLVLSNAKAFGIRRS